MFDEIQFLVYLVGYQKVSTFVAWNDIFSSYPLNKQFEYNRRLLRLEDEPTIDDIPNMTKEQMQALLIKMMSNK